MSATAREYWRRVRRVIDDADVVLEVVDARDPEVTRCREVENTVRRLGKQLIIVINKADLIPRDVVEKWKEYLSQEHPTVYISAKERKGTRKLRIAIKAVAPRLPVKVAIVGYPNVGKSTIINVLKGRYSAPTSPVPGWTRGEQIVRIHTWLIVIDTPGVVPIPSENADVVLRCMVPPEEIDDPVPIALELIGKVLKYTPDAFKTCLGVEGSEPMEILENYARRRGFLLKGGKLNLEEAARSLIRDWQRGKLVYYYEPPPR
ncbi:MAG: GTP-binding protein [Thermoprotei archaeon]|nr:MAG: GTP-binding protein [Thermoprotei archaeon]RLE56803.1 MAG: GTP-binding protein [Thermoprotei archaeon]